MAVSRPCTGMTFRVLSDHRGAPISTIQSTSKEVKWPIWGVLAGKGDRAKWGRRYPPTFTPQYGDFGMEGTDLWLAASGDQRVSVWASDWLRDRCELVDWLSFPAPTLMEVRVPEHLGQGEHLPTLLQCAVPSSGSRLPAAVPRCLLPLG